MGDRNKISIGQRFASRDLRRSEMVVQCYLFSNHLVITTRASNGKLHLVKVIHSILTKEYFVLLQFFQGLWSNSIS